jgi:hypothetical protein
LAVVRDYRLAIGQIKQMVGIALSQGEIQTRLRSDYTEADIGIDRLRQIVETVLGQHKNFMVLVIAR